MHLSRRSLLTLPAALCLAGSATASDETRAVAWRVRMPGHSLVLFGYARIRGDLVPDLARSGMNLIGKAASVRTDVDDDVTMPSLDFERRAPPILTLLPQAKLEELAVITNNSPARDALRSMSGFEASLFLMGEGQHPFGGSAPSIGAALVDHASALRKPVAPIFSHSEYRAAWKPPGQEVMDAVGADPVLYLLDLRRRVGPIGAYFETLYRERRSEAIRRLGDEIVAAGVVLPTEFIDWRGLRAQLVERLLAMPPANETFALVPIGVLSGPEGIPQVLRARGLEAMPIL